MNSGAWPRDCGRILAAKATACASRNLWRNAWTPKAISTHFAIGLQFQTDGKVGRPNRSARAVLNHGAQNVVEAVERAKGLVIAPSDLSRPTSRSSRSPSRSRSLALIERRQPSQLATPVVNK